MLYQAADNWFDGGENGSKNNPIEAKHNPMNLTKGFRRTPAQIALDNLKEGQGRGKRKTMVGHWRVYLKTWVPGEGHSTDGK
jgi:hypothetical protein